jgi:hypothetical protein
MIQRGNCYATSEALYHLLGGKKAGWKPMYMNTRATGNHWFLQHKSGMILDATAKQFPKGVKPDYSKARGNGFLTKKPSKKAKALMETLVWQWSTR